MRSLVAVLLSTLIIAGCSTSSVKNLPPPPASVSDIKKWENSGRVGIRTENDAVSGNFNWVQGPDTFDLSIIGPFGQGSTNLKSLSTQGVELTYDGQVRQGASAGELLYNEFGWQFPVEQVRYWIRGLPYPSSSAIVMNEFNSPRPSEIKQDGWTVSYKEFVQVDGLDLPARLQASNPPYRVNLIINQWAIQ